jgi:hypothetical protein
MASASGHRGDGRVILIGQKMASASGHRGDGRVILIVQKIPLAAVTGVSFTPFSTAFYPTTAWKT